MTSQPVSFNSIGVLLTGIAQVFHVHGHDNEARRVFEQALGWFRSPAAVEYYGSRSTDALATRAFDEGKALYEAGFPDQAGVMLDSIVSIHVNLRDQVAGYRVMVEGSRKGSLDMVRHSDVRTMTPSTELSYFAARAAMAAGDRERAILLLGQMPRRGAKPDVTMWIHRDREWLALRDYPPFQRLVAPR
jgi:hypothetical protein